MSHYPVMLPEVMDALAPKADEVYVDGTFGAGGYTKAILDHAPCRVIAIDRDPAAEERAAGFSAIYGDRFLFIAGCFGDVRELLNAAGVSAVDGLVLDIGVSSMQIDEPERGFSFRFNGPLDMRMDNGTGRTAADIVNNFSEKNLADLIYRYGEERHSRRIARAIIARRGQRPFETTGDLASLVRSMVPKSRKDDSDPATRTFQALRIAVNDELGELERGLEAAPHVLKPGGRLVVVSFHSLEDRIVKTHLKSNASGGAAGSRHMPVMKDASPATLRLLTRKSVTASAKELAENPRSRSARLRAAVRLGEEAA